MAQPNYKQVAELIAERKPFTHAHSMRAEVHADSYRVYSYSTLIATYTYDTGAWWLNETKYSPTTSKQQSLIRRVIGHGAAPSTEVVFP